jgi:hypothetical protein
MNEDENIQSKEAVRIWLAILVEKFGEHVEIHNRYETKRVGWLTQPLGKDGSLESI